MSNHCAAGNPKIRTHHPKSSSPDPADASRALSIDTKTAADRPPISPIPFVYCLSCGKNATEEHFPFCCKECSGAEADYELEKVKEAEKPPVKRRRATVKQEYVGGIYTGGAR